MGEIIMNPEKIIQALLEEFKKLQQTDIKPSRSEFLLILC